MAVGPSGRGSAGTLRIVLGPARVLRPRWFKLTCWCGRLAAGRKPIDHQDIRVMWFRVRKLQNAALTMATATQLSRAVLTPPHCRDWRPAKHPRRQ